jgi:elongation factor Ts
VSFAEQSAQAALNSKVTSVDQLAHINISGTEHNVEQARQALIAKIGENIKLRRIEVLETDGIIGTYIHSNRIGVFVALQGGDENLAKDLAMHIAASKPTFINREDVSAEAIANEREIFLAQAQDSDKPQEIIEKMVDGRISKFLDEVSLAGQAFIKDPSVKVEKLLAQKKAKVLSFKRLEVGEGIDKKEDNFVEEVMAQVRE